MDIIQVFKPIYRVQIFFKLIDTGCVSDDFKRKNVWEKKSKETEKQSSNFPLLRRPFHRKTSVHIGYFIITLSDILLVIVENLAKILCCYRVGAHFTHRLSKHCTQGSDQSDNCAAQHMNTKVTGEMPPDKSPPVKS